MYLVWLSKTIYCVEEPEGNKFYWKVKCISTHRLDPTCLILGFWNIRPAHSVLEMTYFMTTQETEMEKSKTNQLGQITTLKSLKIWAYRSKILCSQRISVLPSSENQWGGKHSFHCCFMMLYFSFGISPYPSSRCFLIPTIGISVGLKQCFKNIYIGNGFFSLFLPLFLCFLLLLSIEYVKLQS